MACAMTEPKRIEFYTTTGTSLADGEPFPVYRWRVVSANGEKGCNPGEGFTRRRDARLSAIDWLGVADRWDLVIPDERDRLAVAKLIVKLHPEWTITEQVWASQLDPDSEERAS